MRGVQGVDRRGEGEIWQIALPYLKFKRLENLLGLCCVVFFDEIFQFKLFEKNGNVRKGTIQVKGRVSLKIFILS